MLDLIVYNGCVIDGNGRPGVNTDIGIKDGTIVKLGELKNFKAGHKINALGKIVCPGFIDSHSHTDLLAPMFGTAESKVLQGVTTDIGGLCGLTHTPVSPLYAKELERYINAFMPKGIKITSDKCTLKDWMDLIDEQGNATNLAMFVGHGSIRIATMGFENRRPKSEELDKMKQMVTDAMECGALGLSSGLIYPPGCYADRNEIVELCKVVAKYDGIYNTHIRNESTDVLSALEEAISIGRESGCSVHISHHKIIGRSNFGLANETLALMKKAREAGIEITCDVYPYAAGSTSITALLPKWIHEGGLNTMLDRLKSPEYRERIIKEIEEDTLAWENIAKNCGWDNIKICFCNNNSSYEGKSIEEISKAKKKIPQETLIDIIIEVDGEATINFFAINEEDIKRIISSNLSMIGTDGYPRNYFGILAEGKPHPRSFSAFPRFLGKYVREENFITLEEAIWKITGFPAERFSLKYRGLIKEGYKADIVVFDKDKIIDKGSFENPIQKPQGIEYVILDGQIIAKNNSFLGKALGKIIRTTD